MTPFVTAQAINLISAVCGAAGTGARFKGSFAYEAPVGAPAIWEAKDRGTLPIGTTLTVTEDETDDSLVRRAKAVQMGATG